jgi:hypothetical protein
MAYSCSRSRLADTNYRSGALLDQEKAGGRYATDLALQLPARVRFRCFALRIIGSTEHLVDAIAHEYERTVLT